jgi:hypothetical protein
MLRSIAQTFARVSGAVTSARVRPSLFPVAARYSATTAERPDVEKSGFV